MKYIALDTKAEEWTPEFILKLGKEWIESATLEHVRQESMQKGEATVLLRQLQKRFGTLPDWVSEKISSAEQETIETWIDRILDAQSLEEVFAD